MTIAGNFRRPRHGTFTPAAGGRGDAVAGVVEGGLDDQCGAPVQVPISQVERVKVG
jgi:hypothetical protein